MKTVIFEKQGIDNLKIIETQIPRLNKDEVLIRIKKIGVNPIDFFTITGIYGLNSKKKLIPDPFPHVPGVEFSGIVEKVGANVLEILPNDHVVVYSRNFDSHCDQCQIGNEMLCRNGSLLGVTSNGGMSEYISVNKNNVLKIPRDLDWNIASSLSVCALTAFHAINISLLSPTDTLLIYGASGNTGMFATQLGKFNNSKVIAVSKKPWLQHFGADYTISDYDHVSELLSEITDDKLADVVINSLGKNTWQSSIDALNYNGRLITYGILTGNIVEFDIQKIYLKQIQIIGSNGGTLAELKHLIKLSPNLKVKIWREFPLEETKKALLNLFNTERDGRIMIDFDK